MDSRPHQLDNKPIFASPDPTRYLIESAIPSSHVQSTDKAHFRNLYTRAAVLYQTKRYSETIEYANKAIAILPEDPHPYSIIALAMAHMKNPEAPEWAKKAITKDPTNGAWRGTLADTYSIRGKWKQALQPLREAVSLSPENASLQSGLGHGLLHAKKLREAVLHLQMAVELDPQNATFHRSLSTGLLMIKDRKGAERHLQRALSLKPDDTDIQSVLGWRLRKKGLEVEADKTFLEALRLDPQNPAAKIGLRVPAGRRTGATDVLLRFSDSIASIRFRRPLALVQGVWFLATLFWVLNHPYVGLWLPELLTACFVAWMMYYAFAPQVVKSIAKRRGVCVH